MKLVMEAEWIGEQVPKRGGAGVHSARELVQGEPESLFGWMLEVLGEREKRGRGKVCGWKGRTSSRDGFSGHPPYTHCEGRKHITHSTRGVLFLWCCCCCLEVTEERKRARFHSLNFHYPSIFAILNFPHTFFAHQSIACTPHPSFVHSLG